jgi:putative ABC transport system permease protein
MRRIELFRFAAGAIFAHPMRSALTTLGVVIGVAAVVCMTSIGLGASKMVEDQIAGLGSNMIIVQPGSSRGPGGFVNQGAGANISLDTHDADAIAANVPGVAAVSSAVRGQSQVAAEGTNWSTQVWGVDASYLTVRDMTIAQGRMFEESDASSGRKVMVIGQTVATNLFPDADPVGQRIRVGRVPFEVIGVLTPKGQSVMGQDQDDLVIGPLKPVRSRVLGRRIRGDSVQNIFVKAADKDAVTEVQETVTELLRERHKIMPGQDDDFQIQNMASMMEATQKTTRTFTILLAAVAGVSLLVGGVGIMNIMLVAVTERTREIGLRMALGATRGDILAQFALEAVTLSLFGGVIGLVLGVLGAFIVSRVGGWPSAIPSWAAPLSLGFSVFVGLVFGAYPSWRAAQLDPIEALRRD